jgi:hypothetical protein
MKKGRAGAMTHDYKRHGVTTLFAALNVLEGKVFGQRMKRHRHEEFIRFLNASSIPGCQRKTLSLSLSILCRSQASQRAGMDRQTSAPRLPFHPNICLVAQCCRGLLRQRRKETAKARRVPLPAGTQRCQPSLPRRNQRKPKALQTKNASPRPVPGATTAIVPFASARPRVTVCKSSAPRGAQHRR